MLLLAGCLGKADRGRYSTNPKETRPRWLLFQLSSPGYLCSEGPSILQRGATIRDSRLLVLGPRAVAEEQGNGDKPRRDRHGDLK